MLRPIKVIAYIFSLAVLAGGSSCVRKKLGCMDSVAVNYDEEAQSDDGSCLFVSAPYDPTPSPLNIPSLFSQKIVEPVIPDDNPQTLEGISLGRKLFYDPILSGDGTQSCSSCHLQKNSFVDDKQFSIGTSSEQGARNSMPIFNLAWNWKEKFFWDGRVTSLEHQALRPVTNPIEMNNTWVKAVASLQATENYPDLFYQAFGTTTIDSILVAKAIAQFERTLISANSRFDQYSLGLISLTNEELYGLDMFMSEDKGDCFHCHGSPSNPLWTDNEFHNNGLDETFTDKGLGAITGNATDDGKFRTPSLRNLAYSAPYMHDGRFATLEEVLEHYSTGLKNSATVSPLMTHISTGGLQLASYEKDALIAFLLSLSDPDFINSSDFNAP